jgi:hypothetical protein
MTKPLLALGLWCVAFVVGVVGLITTGPGNPRFTGTVVFDFKPFCQSFVVQTERGFVLLEWEDGTLFFGEGDSLVGPLHTTGFQSLNVEGRGVMTARFETWVPDLAAAQQVFRERCRLAPDTPSHEGMPVKWFAQDSINDLPCSVRTHRSEPDGRTRPVSELDQPHMRSPFRTAAP